MTDNVIADAGSGGATFATDDIGGIHYPINKITFGGLDSQTLASSGAGNVDAGTQRVVLATDQAVVSMDDNGGSLTVDNAGTFAVQVDGINGTVDANNNSSTPLSGGATFTGTSTDILQFVGITVSVFTDVASATDGLKVQFSSDGTNWDHVDLFTIPAGLGKTFSFQPVARFFRVLYVNGGSAQSVFRLSVILKAAIGKPSSHRISDSIVGEDDAEVVKAVVTAENPSNQFVNVQATAAGNFKVSLEESNGDITGGGTEATAVRVTIATDSTGLLSIDDNGGSITVDNGGTFSVQSTLQAGTAEIGKLAAGVADIGNVKNSGTFPVQAAQSGAYNITNISGTISLPTGASTAAKQLADGHNVTVDNASGASAVNIQDGGNSITVDNGGAFAVQSTLQAGTAAFGKLSANSGVDIGDVDVTSVVPGVGATNLGKAEDSVHSSGDVGVMGLGVRMDAPAAIAADGDYHPLMFSEEGGLWTEHVPNGVNSGNTSTSILTSASVFTGTGVDLLNHDAVVVNIDASHDSATDGMQFQFSSDNTNWDISLDFNYVASNGGRLFQFGVYARFFRVVYTNGGTNQTHFRLQTILTHNTTLTTIHRLVDDASPDRSAQIMKSAIIAQAAGSGDFVAVNATAGGNLKVAVEEFDGPLAAGTNLIGDVGLGVRTSGGIPIDSVYYDNDLDETAVAAKASAGQIYFIVAMNLTAAPLYLQLFNVAQGSVTVGTTVPDMEIPIPANADSDGAGFIVPIPVPIEFDVAITVACSTDTQGNGAPAANACHVNIGIN